MRKIDRSSVPPPKSLVDPGGAGEVELALANVHFAIPGEGVFTFAAYKGDDVKEALEKLFSGKCAYCESYFAAMEPADIEHFRPKGAVQQCSDHPGYWWLAAIWENLLASCIDCNRRRRHTTFDSKLRLEEMLAADKELSGKADSFPILGVSHARSFSDNLNEEDPALIDPTTRDPVNHLQWTFEHGFPLVSPRVVEGVLDAYGFATERTFGLNRQGLVNGRKHMLTMLAVSIKIIEGRLDSSLELGANDARNLQNKCWDEFMSLYQFADPAHPYSMMFQSYLDETRSRLRSKYLNIQRAIVI